MDIVVGTKIKMNETVFEGYPNSRRVGRRTITGTVLKESYGDLRGQHTFTIEVEESEGYSAPEPGKKIRRKGRNVYRNSTVIDYPENHASLAIDKHRRARDAKDRKHWNWILEYAESPCWDNGERLDRIPEEWLKANPSAVEQLRGLGYEPF